jgi:hypothetical protein
VHKPAVRQLYKDKKNFYNNKITGANGLKTPLLYLKTGTESALCKAIFEL